MKKLRIFLFFVLTLIALAITGCGKNTIRTNNIAISNNENSLKIEPLCKIAGLLENLLNKGNLPDPSKMKEKEFDNGYTDGQEIFLDAAWEFADFSEIHSGHAVYYKAKSNVKGIVIGVNAGHGTKGVGNTKTYCHPDKTPKVTGGTTSEGNTKAIAVSFGMDFKDGTQESEMTLAEAKILKDLLLADGYDVLMIRDSEDVQLDNIARTVICNNVADCHIAIHWDGDGLNYDKGCFFMSVPNEGNYKNMYPVSEIWKESDALGYSLIEGLRTNENTIFESGSLDEDLTQTSFSKIPSVDIELGNQASPHDELTLTKQARGLKTGIDLYFKDGRKK